MDGDYYYDYNVLSPTNLLDSTSQNNSLNIYNSNEKLSQLTNSEEITNFFKSKNINNNNLTIQSQLSPPITPHESGEKQTQIFFGENILNKKSCPKLPNSYSINDQHRTIENTLSNTTNPDDTITIKENSNINVSNSVRPELPNSYSINDQHRTIENTFNSTTNPDDNNRNATNSDNIVQPEILNDLSIKILTEDQFAVYTLLRKWGMEETTCEKFISKLRVSTKNMK